MPKLFLFLLLGGFASAAQAEMSADDRERLLHYYPCATSLSDDELRYLADWANATHRDPCMLTTQEFAKTFQGYQISE